MRSTESLNQIGGRVGRLFGVPFESQPHEEDPTRRIMIAQAHFFALRLLHWPFYQDPAVQVFQLRGENVIKPRWDYEEDINLSPWILQEFRNRDSAEWYCPTIEELRAESESL